MASQSFGCPTCGHADLAPRLILVGQTVRQPAPHREYREIITLKCQKCGWIGERLPDSALSS